MKLKKHKLVLSDYDITEIINKVRPQHNVPKSYRPDADRMVYAQLLKFTNNYLQQTTSRTSKDLEEAPMNMELLGEEFFFPLFEQMINLAKRQCSEKATLMKILFDFYREGISSNQKNCEQKLKSLTAQYTLNLVKKEDTLALQNQKLSSQLKAIAEENEKKWKTFYLIVRDNRVLRRQKGKLMRVIEEQKLKVSRLNQEIIALSRQNEKNRLLMNYQNEKESLAIFLKNSASIHKLEQFMKQYPKYSKKLLKIHLHQLEIAEQNSLNQKIQYIIKAANEQEELYDEEEDLVDIAKGNKLLFNAQTQTDPQAKMLVSSCTSITRLTKVNQGAQTIRKLRLNSQILCLTHDPKQVHKTRRRRGEKMNETQLIEIEQIKKQIRQKQLTFVKRTVYAKIPSQVNKPAKQYFQLQNIQSKVIDFCICFDKEEASQGGSYTQLPTHFRLNQDIKRSKQFVYNKKGGRTSRLSEFNDPFQMNESQQNIKSQNLNSEANIKSQFVIGAQQSDKVINLKRSKERLSKISRFGLMEQQNIVKKNSSKNSGSIRSSLTSSNRLHEALVLTQNYDININSTNFQKSEFKIEEEDSDHSFDHESNILVSGQNSQQRAEKRDEGKFENILNIRRQAEKQRKSGFAVNRPSKKVAIKNIKTPINTLKVNHKSSISRLSQINNHQVIDNAKEEKGSSGKKDIKSKTPTHQHKVINFFSPQSNRMIDKIMKAIFTQRKQLQEAKTTLEHFIKTFLINQYGSQHQYALVNKITLKSQINPMNQAFDIMLDSNKSGAELQIAFNLFSKVLLLNGSSVMQIDCQRANYIKKQILKTQEGTYQGQQTIHLCTLYLDLHHNLQSSLKSCELVQFIQQIVPGSQLALNYEEIKQILGILNKDEHFYKNMMMLRQYKTQIAPYHLCLLAFREKWLPVFHIKTYVQERYALLFGQFDENIGQMIYNHCLKIQKLKWIMNLLQNSFQSTLIDSCRIFKLKYASLLFISVQVDQQIPLAETLSDLAGQYDSLMLKSNFGSITP